MSQNCMEIDCRIGKDAWKGAKRKESQKGGKRNDENRTKQRPCGFVLKCEQNCGRGFGGGKLSEDSIF